MEKSTSPVLRGGDDGNIIPLTRPWEKGRRYGTILIDLERHQVIDVLPDREAETLVAWLKAHPGVEIISRDRAGAYAEGASKGAPQAIQIADRFHLLVNVLTAMTRLIERKHESLKRIHEEEEAMDPALPPAPSGKEPSCKPLTITQAQQQARRTRRNNRYQEVKTLHEQGVTQRAIAALTGLHRDTVHRYLNTSELPEIVRPHRRSKRGSLQRISASALGRGRAQRDPSGG